MTFATARPTLPVWPTVRQAFTTVPTSWQALVRIFWAWVAIEGALLVLYIRMFPLRTFPPLGVPPSPESFVPPSPAFLLTAVLLVVVGSLAFCSTAVAWHRLILLGEQPPAIYLGLGGPVMRYLGRCLLIALVALPIFLLCAMLLLPLVAFRLFEKLPAPLDPFTPPPLGHILVLSIVNLVVLLPALLVISRLAISLPGIAVGRPMTLSEAWQSTAGNTARLLGGTLLVYVPSYVIGLAIQLATWPPRWPPSGNLMAAMLLNFLVAFLVAVAGISFLSLSYRFLVGTAQPGRAEAD
jgi:hypothetical protein